MSLNSYPKIDIKQYSDTGHYVEVKPVEGTNIFGGKNDVQIKKKVAAKPQHAVLIVAGLVVGIFILSAKLDERF